MLVYINGRFLTQPVTGVQRFALELLHALDDTLSEHLDLLQGYQFICLVPASSQTRSFPNWKNIAIERKGRLSGKSLGTN